MRSNLKTALLFVFQTLLILVPLTWTSATSELFEFPKMLLTYALTIVIGGLWLSRMIVEKKIIFRRTPFEFPILLFLGSQLISTLTSIDIHTSIFGYYSRFNGGLLSLICYALIYFAAVSNFDKRDVKIIIQTLVYTALLSSLYAFPEHFGHSPSCLIITGKFNASCWVQDVQNRVFGTFGQPNWLAGYLVVILPITLFAAINERTTKQRLIAAGLSLLSLMVILFTKSQSGIAAAVVAIAISVVLIAIQKKKTLALLAIIPLFLLVFAVKHTAVNKSLQSLSYINPFYSNVDAIAAKDIVMRGNGGTDSMIVRRIVWQGAWELAVKHPFFGTGVETFAYSYYNTRPAAHNLLSEWNFLYNKAHNEFLNFAATTGFFGLGTYIFFLGSYIVWSLSKCHSDRSGGIPTKSAATTKRSFSTDLVDQDDKGIIAALLAGFIALCISNFFGFSTVPVNILLFLFPALAFLLTDESLEISAKAKRVKPTLTFNNQLVIGIIGLICLLLLLAVNRGLRADRAYVTGKAAFDTKNYQTAITKLQDSIRLVSDEPLYTDELAQAASEIAANLHANNQIAQASEAATIAVELANRTMNLNKHHLNFYKSRAKIFINLTQINPRYAVEAAATLDAAIKLAPTDAKLWLNRGLLAKELGYKEEALKSFAKTIELKPNDDTAKLYYTTLKAEIATASAKP